ncbi:MAG: proline dehydrogenase family protein [Bryobacterales bacterium]|nr:proline dehydrogenase family protein [Bryobacterales bacterium]
MILRNTLLYLSRQTQLRGWMETSPLAGRFTKRFVAGQTLEQGIAVCRKLNAGCILTTIDHLGENVTSAAEAEASRDAYLEALERVAAENLPSTVSIKPTQFGMDLSEEFCQANLEPLVAAAARIGSCVEIDMEASGYLDRTLRLVRAMHSRHPSVRAVIQAYLRRGEADVEALCGDRIPVRLCKGAYNEPATLAFPSKRDVDRNYLRLARVLLRKGVYPAFATHDPNMVNPTLDAALELGVQAGQFEFQMLYGIRRDVQNMLTSGGYRLRLYVPYGVAWYPYFMRRLAERPANLLFLARNLFRH